MSDLSTGIVAHGRRYLTLDAMRGVAALIVVIYHYGFLIGGLNPKFGYLAVDLFFVLSGFVLAHANDRKFSSGRLTLRKFIMARIVRLGPLFYLGAALGLIAIFIGVGADFRGSKLLVALLLNLMCLPGAFAHGSRSLFPINDPFWSLFFELWVANLIFGLLWRQLKGMALFAFVAACGVGLLLAEKHWYTINLGWNLDTFIGGFLRVNFSFFAGVVVARFHTKRPPKLRLPSLLVLAALTATLFAPLENRAGHLFELLAVFLIFPALVYFGAEAIEFQPKLAARLGDASYALYTIHMPIVLSLRVLAGSSPLIHTVVAQLILTCLLFALALAAAAGDEAIRAAIWRAIQRRHSRPAGVPSESKV